MSKAILFTGAFQYGVVDDFIRGIQNYLTSVGYSIQQINLADTTHLQQQLTDENFRDVTLVFSVNGLGADLIPYVPCLRQVPFYSLLLDHPLHSLTRFFGTPLRLLCVDQAHVTFARAVGMQAEFCPHAVTLPPVAEATPTGSGHQIHKQGILFPGSFFSASHAKAIIDQHFPQAWTWLHNPAVRTITDFLHQLGFMQPGKTPLLQLNRNTITILCHCDFYLRAMSRDQLLQRFADAGLAVRVMGNGWEQAQHLPVHQYLPAVPFRELSSEIQQAQYVLHHSPGFDAGLHERILYSISAGTQVLCEQTPYLTTLFPQHSAVRWFDNVSALAQQFSTVSTDQYQQQLAHSQALIRQQHTWDARLQALLAPQLQPLT